MSVWGKEPSLLPGDTTYSVEEMEQKVAPHLSLLFDAYPSSR